MRSTTKDSLTVVYNEEGIFPKNDWEKLDETHVEVQKLGWKPLIYKSWGSLYRIKKTSIN